MPLNTPAVVTCPKAMHCPFSFSEAAVVQLHEEKVTTAANLAAISSKAGEDLEALEEASVAVTSLSNQIQLAEQGGSFPGH